MPLHQRRSCLHRFANSQEHVLDHFWISWRTVRDRFDLRGDADLLQVSSCIPSSMPDGMQALPFQPRPALPFGPWRHHSLNDLADLPEFRHSFQAYTIELPHNDLTGFP
jgi:hypothetical protein